MIKLDYLGEIRKVKTPNTYEELINLCKEKFESLKDLDVTQIKLTYIDHENDTLSISS